MMNFLNAQQNDDVADEVVAEVTGWLTPILDTLNKVSSHLLEQIWSINGAIQLAIVIAGGLLAWLLARPLKSLLSSIWPGRDITVSNAALVVVKRLTLPIVWVVLMWIGGAVLDGIPMGSSMVRTAASLLNAWIVIQFVASFVTDRGIAKAFAAIAWFVAALNIFGLLGRTLDFLDETSLGVSISDSPLTALDVIKVILLAIVLLWIASAIASLIRGSLQRSERLTPSVQTLVAQGARLTLLFAAVMITLNSIGIDLTALAVFSGAIGVGIGFGLQSIFSNLMAGIILLMEKSVKVGDFIEFDNGLSGEVREINVRATMVTTNDNVDILVPNEEFIKTRVTNWTLREGYRRVRIPFGVAYGSDKDLVKKAVLEAADEVPHNLTGEGARDPQVWLVGFGDSSLDFELVIWVRPESVKRPSAVRADYNWAIESALGRYGIEIPFPQRDLHIRSGLPEKL